MVGDAGSPWERYDGKSPEMLSVTSDLEPAGVGNELLTHEAGIVTQRVRQIREVNSIGRVLPLKQRDASSILALPTKLVAAATLRQTK